MADKKRKQKRPARQWTLPDPSECLKGGTDQENDLRLRLLRYARQHPDEFPGMKPMGAAHAKYAAVMSNYLAAAQALGKCPTAQALNAVPMVILSKEFLDSITNRDANDEKLYYDTLPDAVRMTIPMKGVSEFAVSTAVPGLAISRDTSLVHIVMTRQGDAVPDGSVTRSLRITQFYKSQDESYHPCMVVDANLFVNPKRGGEDGDRSDMISIDRNSSRGLLEYFTAVSPDELGWDDADIRFWEQVTLTHAAYSYHKAVETRSDVILANICTSTLNVLAKAISEHEFEEYEDDSREAQRAAARPPHLRPDPYMDSRKTWRCGPLLYKAHEIPELADGFPDLKHKEAADGEEKEAQA